MKAAVVQGRGRLVVESRPRPEATPGEVVVAVDRCGVCGTDLHLVMEGWGRPGSVPGHEFSGVVAEVGEGVDRWEVGDAVVGVPQAICGRCDRCRAGRTALCRERSSPGAVDRDGAFAQFVAVDAHQLVAIPGGVDHRVAALAEPVAVARHAINRAAVATGERVLVFGIGPIGALVVAMLALDGIEVHAVEPNSTRAALATSLGARTVASPEALEVISIAEPFRLVDSPFDVVLECSGRPDAVTAGLTQLASAGRLVLVGTGIGGPAYDNNRIILNELTVTGAYNYDPNGIADALAMLAGGALPVDALIEADDVPLEGLLDAMAAQVDGQVTGKIMVDPSAGIGPPVSPGVITPSVSDAPPEGGEPPTGSPP